MITNNLIRLAIAFFLVAIFSFPSQATTLSTLKFEKYNVEDGLSQASILAMHQDKKGLMWFATEDGLNRFDGYEFLQYKTSNFLGLTIQAIESDRDGNLWVGTDKGLNVMLAGDEHFINFTSENTPSLTNDTIKKIFLSSAGTLWVGSGNGLFAIEIHPANNDISITATKINKQPLNVTAIEEIEPNTLWVGTRVDLTEFNISTNSSKVIKAAKHGELLDIMSIFKSSNNEVWVGSFWHGIFKYSLEGEQLIHFTTRSTPAIVEDSIYAIAEDGLGRIWVGFTNLGIMVYQNGHFNLSTYDVSDPWSLSSNAIESILKDKDGNMWVGTTRGGLNKHRLITEEFIHLKKSSAQLLSLLSKDIRALLVDANSNLWIGSSRQGISILNVDEPSIQHLTAEDGLAATDIGHIIQDSDNYIWSASSDGLTKINAESKTVEAIYTPKNSALKHGRIISIVDDANGYLWLSHWDKGLSKFNKKTKEATFYNVNDDKLPSPYISSLTFDPSGTLWLSSSAGLSEYIPESDTFKTYKLQGKNEPESFADITLEADGFMWLPSRKGLYAFDINKKQYIDIAMPNILKNDNIYHIIKDLTGFYWASTNSGLIRFQKNKTNYTQFQSKDGLQSNEFNAGAAAQFPDGKIAFGGINGVNIFTPNRIANIPSAIKITAITLEATENENNKRYINNLPKQLILPPNVLSLSVSFSALNFSHPLDTQYSYRIIGIDNKWIATKSNTITIPQLANGHYKLEIRATNTFGEWQENAAELEFEFLPPWYQQKLAYLFYMLVLLSLLYCFYHLKTKNIRKHSEKLERIVNKRTKELFDTNSRIENQANALKIAIEEKKRLYETISHELRTPITLILGPIRQLRKKVADNELIATTTLIERNANRLNRLVNQLLDLSRTESVITDIAGQTNLSELAKELMLTFQPYASDANIKLIFSPCKETVVDLNFDDAEKLLSNLLSNAIKYSKPNDLVTLVINSSNQFVIITINDTGIGINPDKIPNIFTRFYRVDSEQTSTIEGSGIGLSIVSSIVKKANGSINVASELGKGTTFTIKLPLSNQEISTKQAETSLQKNMLDSELGANLPHLLLIDDNEDILTYVSSVLKNDYHITTAPNGKDGIIAARNIIPDIIVSDVMMPDIDGLQLLSTLKSDELTNHIPIILLTAKGSDESKIKGLKLHADDYISKPFNEDELSLRLRNILDARDILKKKFSAEIMIEPHATIKKEQPIFIIKLDNIIEKHYQDISFSVAKLAKEAAVGERQLLRKLRATADVGAKEYIRSYRLKKAAELLSMGHTATYVAIEVGFSSAAYFSNCFKAFYGVTPSQYTNSTSNISP